MSRTGPPDEFLSKSTASRNFIKASIIVILVTVAIMTSLEVSLGYFFYRQNSVHYAATLQAKKSASRARETFRRRPR